MDIKNSDCFAITCKESGCLLAGFIIAVSKFYRGHSAMADPFVIVKRSERQQSLGEFALRQAVEYSSKFGNHWNLWNFRINHIRNPESIN
jgi:hypothetical protein